MKAFLKHSFLLVFCLVVLAGLLAGCGVDKEAQEEILHYYNEELKELAALDDEVMSSFNSVVGDNFVDDATLYNELNENTIPRCNKLIEAADNVTIKNDELREVHKRFIDYTRALKNALLKIEGGIAAQDFDKVVEAQNLMYDAEDIQSDFLKQLDDLCDKYGLVDTEEQYNVKRPNQSIS